MRGESKGAYIDWMAWSWDNGPLPLDKGERGDIANIKTPAAFRRIWRQVGPKWQLIDGGYVNLRLEQQRKDLADYFAGQSAKGLASAAARSNRRSTEGQPNVNRSATEGATERQPKVNSSSSSSIDQEQDQDQRVPRQISTGESVKVLTVLAHMVLDRDDRRDDSDLADELKTLAAQNRIAYDGRVITKALESAKVQRQRERQRASA